MHMGGAMNSATNVSHYSTDRAVAVRLQDPKLQQCVNKEHKKSTSY